MCHLWVYSTRVRDLVHHLLHTSYVVATTVARRTRITTNVALQSLQRDMVSPMFTTTILSLTASLYVVTSSLMVSLVEHPQVAQRVTIMAHQHADSAKKNSTK